METKTWRIEAPDGKTLFSFCAVFLSAEEKHRETFSKLISFYKTQFEGEFREKLLKNYQENRDPGKRLHVQPLRCTLEGVQKREKGDDPSFQTDGEKRRKDALLQRGWPEIR